MASLPNKSFVINYNARDYVPSTYTIPKTSGQTLDMDMVFSGGAITKATDHITTENTEVVSIFNFPTTDANPFNVTSTNNNLTLVFKAKYANPSVSRGDIFRNISTTQINWTIRIGSRENYPASNTKVSFCHNNSVPNFDQGLSYTCGDTITAVVSVNNGVFTIKNLSTSETTTPITISSNGGYGQPANVLTMWGIVGDFYWCYASREVLTDEEVQQVIDFNESSFGPDSTGTTIAKSGGTSTANIESETGWTVTTKPTWVTVSPSSGESGTTAITFTIKKNNFYSRTGTVVFTDDGGNEAEYTIEQGGTENQIPYDKMFRNNRRIN